jgi:UV DNA damage endonuclease
MRVGYACICLGNEELRCQRTTVLRNATPERLRALIHANIDGLEQILTYNEARGYHLFRLGNAFIPFASHPVNQIRWWEEYGQRLAQVGRWVLRHGHRLSFHASHFTILNSGNPEVVRAALADITYMARVLDAMELGPEHKIILHLGVATPTIEAAEGRFARALEQVPLRYRERLVLENDERWYSADRVVAMSERVGLPVVLDLLHHQCHPGRWGALTCAGLLERVFDTWRHKDGSPKIHFSTQDPTKKTGAHGYWIDGLGLEGFLEQSRGVRRDLDIMFEAKGKDLAVQEVMPVLRADPRFADSSPNGATPGHSRLAGPSPGS